MCHPLRLFAPFVLALSTALLLPVAVMAAGDGSLAGHLTDAATHQPLHGAIVALRGATRYTVTDTAGVFTIPALPAGTYTLDVRRVGYERQAVTDLVVRPGRRTQADVALASILLRVADVHVRPAYFPRGTALATGATEFSTEEIRRAPGAAGDVSRIVSSLPGIAKVNDQSNGLVVRGGSAIENAIFVDGIEVPNINHFPTQGSTAGPIGLVNADLVRTVQFSAGGFGAGVGDRLSAVMQLDLRDGSREKWTSQVDLNLAGGGVVAEGPWARGRGTWLASLRRSVLDLVVRAFDTGTTAIPRYGDYTAKATLDAGRGHRFAVVALGADDHLATDVQTARDNDMIIYGRQSDTQAAGGVTWSSVWGTRTLSRTTLSTARLRYDDEFRETASAGAPLLVSDTRERQWRVRHTTQWTRDARLAIEAGADWAHDSAGLDNAYAARVTALGDSVAAARVRTRAAQSRTGAFAQVTWTPDARLTLSTGTRLDALSPRSALVVSPRAAAAWRAGARTQLTAAAGVYRQRLPLSLRAQSASADVSRGLRARHAVLGAHRDLGEGARLSLEGYLKDYARMPLDPATPALFPLDEVYYDAGIYTAHPALTATGAARARGLELALRQKFVARGYGAASLAWSHAAYRGLDGVWRPRAVDNRVVLAAEGGVTPRRGWQVSAKWVYAGGTPYTPVDEAASRVLARTVLDSTQVNARRMPAYHSLNLRVDRRVSYRSTEFLAYLSVWNAYDRANVASYYWHVTHGRVEAQTQWRILPLFGLEYAF